MKKVIVTGAGQGIGLEVVIQLCQEGYFVIWNEIDPSVFKLASSQLEKLSLTTHCGILGDSSSDLFLNELSETIHNTPGTLYGCVCNSGITTFGNFLNYSRESMDMLLKVNVSGTFFLIQFIAKLLKEGKIKGSIVVTTSVTGHQAHPDLVAYGMTKGALIQLVRNLVVELSSLGIRINAISPGATLTERTAMIPDFENQWTKITPMGTIADVSDISNAISFMLSEKSRQITGQTLIVDGGWTSYSPPPGSV
jgi:NAD(P)-dependent dehydrogenase (short-subunit alcohol dehydrogenase family)